MPITEDDVGSTGRDLLGTRWRHYIGGEWTDGAGDRDGDGGDTFDDLDPYSGAVMARVPRGSGTDARRAVDAAAGAFPAWAALPPVAKQDLFLKAADLLRARQHELVHLAGVETGCTFGFGMFQTEFVIGLLRQAAGIVYAPTGTVIPSDLPGALAMGLRQPVGVVAGLAPWNAPLILSLRAVVGPLALGNTVVLKPSEHSPLIGGLALAEVFDAAGFPPGSVNVVTHAPGEAAPIGEELMADPRVRRISFTGSTATGRLLAEQAGRHLKRMVLELGGQNPLLVLDDADVGYAVDAACFGAFLHQGQICMSTRRILVDRAVADEFTDRLVAKTASLKAGDPAEPDTIIGPLITPAAVELARRRLADAVDRGARVLAGGGDDGRVLQATLVTDVPDDSDLGREETFAPIAAIRTVDGLDEAVARANDTRYGLVAGVITTDHDRGVAVARRLEAGIVHVNDQTVHDEPQMPFGGVKDSGFGRFGGLAAADDFTELRWITVQAGTRPFPF
ncbi:MAG TPA: aldehyde dehydrogenase family protein [Acidimicrobiales bacterium]|nr:aldehyde dehydrogenase family protein [Acidimicrobiales bacterium]